MNTSPSFWSLPGKVQLRMLWQLPLVYAFLLYGKVRVWWDDR